MNGRMLLGAALIACATTAQAGGVGLRAGTTGVGADYGFDIAPTLGGRIGLSAMNWNTHVDTSDVRYDAKAITTRDCQPKNIVRSRSCRADFSSSSSPR